MKTILTIAVTFLVSQSWSMGSKPVSEGHQKVHGYASEYVSRGAPACNRLTKSAKTDMNNACTAFGNGSTIIKIENISCSCTPTNDQFFSRCTANASGVCKL